MVVHFARRRVWLQAHTHILYDGYHSEGGLAMRNVHLIAVTVLCPATSLLGGTIHVPADAPTIQIAIEKAQPFDTIIVAPGTYFEAINFGGKVIVVQSENPNDDDVVANTVIDAGGLGDVVTFSGGEDQVNTILSGFTITGGTVGIRGNGSKALIRRCVIRDNSSIGIHRANGVIEDTKIIGNSSYGLHDCDGSIQRCEIRDNNHGIAACDGSIEDSRIIENRGEGVIGGNVDINRTRISSNLGSGISGGHIGDVTNSYVVGNLQRGFYSNTSSTFNGVVVNTVVAGNRTGGFVESRKNVVSCTVSGNRRYGFENHLGAIRHVIIWDNALGALTNSTTPVFSGTTNPYFVKPGYWDQLNDVWIDGNYSLSPDSPYIDAGNPAYASDTNNPTTDIDGNPRIVGARVDIGAFEFQAECTGADFDGDGTPDVCDSDIDNDGVTNVPDKCDDTPSGIAVDSEGRPIGDLNLDCRVNLRDMATMQNQFFGP